jgi:hypothetical protein
MILGVKGEVVNDFFSVTDESHNLVSGIDSTAFTYHIYDSDKNEVSLLVNTAVTELGNGHYNISFVPNETGTWLVSVYHQIYFPWGKTETFQIYNNSVDTLSFNFERILGLVQENYCLDQQNYNGYGLMTAARIRIYSDSASVGSDSNVIATYQVLADWDDSRKVCTSYRVIKI